LDAAGDALQYLGEFVKAGKLETSLPHHAGIHQLLETRQVFVHLTKDGRMCLPHFHQPLKLGIYRLGDTRLFVRQRRSISATQWVRRWLSCNSPD
jgi:hypothetical protein